MFVFGRQKQKTLPQYALSKRKKWGNRIDLPGRTKKREGNEIQKSEKCTTAHFAWKLGDRLGDEEIESHIDSHICEEMREAGWGGIKRQKNGRKYSFYGAPY